MESSDHMSYTFPLGDDDLSWYWKPRLMLGAFDWTQAHSKILGLYQSLPRVSTDYVNRNLPLNAATQEKEELYKILFEDASEYDDEHREILQKYTKTKALPKEASLSLFWLYARVEVALYKSSRLKDAHQRLRSPKKLESQHNRKAIEWLLFEYWQQCGIEIWLADNVDSLIYHDIYDCHDIRYPAMSEDEYREWIQDVQSGLYRRV